MQAARVEPEARTGHGQAREVVTQASDLSAAECEGLEDAKPGLERRDLRAVRHI
jgi:hypothetical protein